MWWEAETLRRREGGFCNARLALPPPAQHSFQGGESHLLHRILRLLRFLWGGGTPALLGGGCGLWGTPYLLGAMAAEGGTQPCAGVAVDWVGTPSLLGGGCGAPSPAVGEDPHPLLPLCAEDGGPAMNALAGEFNLSSSA